MTCLCLVLVSWSFACRTTRTDLGFSGLSANDQMVTGVLVVRSSRSMQDCTRTCQKQILDKFLYEGFEGTALWRPQELLKELKDEKLIDRLYRNIYVTQSASERGKNCRCSFQFNVASTRKILEHEGYLPAFGY